MLGDDLRQRLDAMPDSAAKVDLINRLGMEQREHDPRAAVQLCDMAIVLSRRLPYPGGLARALRAKGASLLLVAEFEPALRDTAEALAIFERLGDAPNALKTVNIIGNLHRRMGDYAAAAARYRAVLSQSRAEGDRLMEASACNNLGNVSHSLGDEEQAARFYQQGLALFRELGETRYATMTLINLAGIHRTRGDYPRALDCCQQALSVFPEYGDRLGEAAAWFDMGLTYRDMGDPERAAEVWQRSIEIAREVGDIETEMSALVNTAQSLNQRHLAVAALEVLDLAALIADRIKDLTVLASYQEEYAAAYEQLGDATEAEAHRRLCLDQRRAIARQQSLGG
ncbi:MAG: tetratricopeptide repeat protein [Candidatus Edwardsbacteria bacterium]|jgi:tetratricopeptide (TPR) repeat protein|nr:tetratricopeptide repeat protein [Candidatus Edwardsbacteria bacterium]